MFASAPTWNDERLEALKNHFAAGLSCRQIAAEIGVSRNAVIGKLSRLGLSREKTGDAIRRKKPRERRARTGSVPRLQFEMLRQVYDEAAFTDTPVVSERRCTLFELGKEHCRWPVNTDTEAFAFCGNPPLAGMPYCQGHTRLAYRSLARRAG
ncbi:GcrA family cell cycle regulator [Bradyrhizobium sp.]|uniref:GcrA family cell cycle regulator n=1 Tax=Bradyrhizobium sp. TaxID=376 RepID=UPI0040383E8A